VLRRERLAVFRLGSQLCDPMRKIINLHYLGFGFVRYVLTTTAQVERVFSQSGFMRPYCAHFWKPWYFSSAMTTFDPN